MGIDLDGAYEIICILRRAKTPSEAAATLSFVRASLHILGGGDSEKKVRAMIKDDDEAALAVWSELTGKALAS